MRKAGVSIPPQVQMSIKHWSAPIRCGLRLDVRRCDSCSQYGFQESSSLHVLPPGSKHSLLLFGWNEPVDGRLSGAPDTDIRSTLFRSNPIAKEHRDSLSRIGP